MTNAPFRLLKFDHPTKPTPAVQRGDAAIEAVIARSAVVLRRLVLTHPNHALNHAEWLEGYERIVHQMHPVPTKKGGA